MFLISKTRNLRGGLPPRSTCDSNPAAGALLGVACPVTGLIYCVLRVSGGGGVLVFV